jgi:hypothetical protein
MDADKALAVFTAIEQCAGVATDAILSEVPTAEREEVFLDVRENLWDMVQIATQAVREDMTTKEWEAEQWDAYAAARLAELDEDDE